MNTSMQLTGFLTQSDADNTKLTFSTEAILHYSQLNAGDNIPMIVDHHDVTYCSNCGADRDASTQLKEAFSTEWICSNCGYVHKKSQLFHLSGTAARNYTVVAEEPIPQLLGSIYKRPVACHLYPIVKMYDGTPDIPENSVMYSLTGTGYDDSGVVTNYESDQQLLTIDSIDLVDAGNGYSGDINYVLDVKTVSGNPISFTKHDNDSVTITSSADYILDQCNELTYVVVDLHNLQNNAELLKSINTDVNIEVQNKYPLHRLNSRLLGSGAAFKITLKPATLLGTTPQLDKPTDRGKMEFRGDVKFPSKHATPLTALTILNGKLVNATSTDTAQNYQLTNVTGHGAILPKILRVTARASDKVYDGNANLTNVQVVANNADIVQGDAVKVVASSATADGADVGEHTIILHRLKTSLLDGDNYTPIQVADDFKVNITPRYISIDSSYLQLQRSQNRLKLTLVLANVISTDTLGIDLNEAVIDWDGVSTPFTQIFDNLDPSVTVIKQSTGQTITIAGTIQDTEIAVVNLEQIIIRNIKLSGADSINYRLNSSTIKTTIHIQNNF